MIIKRPSRRGGLFDVKTLYSITVPKLTRTIRIFITPSPTFARNRKNPLTDGSLRSLYPSIYPREDTLYAVAPL